MNHEIAFRLVFFLAIFGAIAYWEHRSPRRSLAVPKKGRWISNLSFMIGNPVLMRLIMPILAVDLALMAQNHSWGLLNYFDLPFGVKFVVGVALLDLVIYLQHVMFHAAATVAFAYDPPCGPGLRFDHRIKISSDRNYSVNGSENGGDFSLGTACRSSADV